MSRLINAVVIAKPGGPDELKLCKVTVPMIGPDEVLIRVAAGGVNRYDLLQRGGLLPGQQAISGLVPGLECSGRIVDVGSCVTEWQIGDEVCAFLKGGGYAEEVAVPAAQILRAPLGFSLVDCATLPELAYTTWLAVSVYGKLHPSDIILIHEGCGEIGMLALLLAKRKGARVYVVGDTEEKLKAWKSLGANMCITGKGEKVVSQVMEVTRDRGVNVILVDEATDLRQNLNIMSLGGAIVVIRLRGYPIAEVYLPHLIANNCKIKVLDRTRKLIDPTSVIKDVKEHVWPAIESSVLRPILNYRSYELSEAANAHRHMEMVPDCWKTILTLSSGDESGTSQSMEEAIQSRFSSLNLRRRRS